MWRVLTDTVQGELLEIGCGTGRVLVPLGQYGRTITGIDISQQAIEICRQKVNLADLVSQVTLHQADMRSLRLPKTDYAFAFVPINTFMHCETQADQTAALQSIYQHLQPGGTLVIDLFNPTPHRLMEADGQLVLESQQHDALTENTTQWFVSRRLYPAEQIEAVTFILDEIQANGTVSRNTLTFSLRYFHRFEMALLLTQAGFHVQEILGGYDMSPYDDQSERLIFLAQKV